LTSSKQISQRICSWLESDDLSQGAVNRVTWICFRSAAEEDVAPWTISAACEGVDAMAVSDAAPCQGTILRPILAKPVAVIKGSERTLDTTVSIEVLRLTYQE
jgi:hypothetical protein